MEEVLDLAALRREHESLATAPSVLEPKHKKDHERNGEEGEEGEEEDDEEVVDIAALRSAPPPPTLGRLEDQDISEEEARNAAELLAGIDEEAIADEVASLGLRV